MRRRTTGLAQANLTRRRVAEHRKTPPPRDLMRRKTVRRRQITIVQFRDHRQPTGQSRPRNNHGKLRIVLTTATVRTTIGTEDGLTELSRKTSHGLHRRGRNQPSVNPNHLPDRMNPLVKIRIEALRHVPNPRLVPKRGRLNLRNVKIVRRSSGTTEVIVRTRIRRIETIRIKIKTTISRRTSADKT
jgi:hypothetical protein